MATKNSRVSGYVSQELFKLVETYVSENACSQSDLVQRAVTAFLSVGVSSAALPDGIRVKLEALAYDSFRSPEDQARYLLQNAIENAWLEKQGELKTESNHV